MNETIEEQLEEARRLLPTPANVGKPAGKLVKWLLLYLAFVGFFIICFHVFNDMSKAVRSVDDSARARPRGAEEPTPGGR